MSALNTRHAARNTLSLSVRHFLFVRLMQWNGDCIRFLSNFFHLVAIEKVMDQLFIGINSSTATFLSHKSKELSDGNTEDASFSSLKTTASQLSHAFKNCSIDFQHSNVKQIERAVIISAETVRSSAINSCYYKNKRRLTMQLQPHLYDRLFFSSFRSNSRHKVKQITHGKPRL